jgi:type I restriction enzyme R subunit
MLTTGFDCREVLHLVMCRKVFSPILYQQMRGRGTRTAPHIAKQQFVIYDFFRNHQYFNDDGTDITWTGGAGGGPGTPLAPQPRELIELGLKDEWLEAVTYVEVGPEGERIDKKDYLTNWEQTIRQTLKDNPILKKIRDGQTLSTEEETTLAGELNSPKFYFNEDNLRRAYRRPGGNLIEFIRAALGGFKLKSREDELTENFCAWLVAKQFSPLQAEYLTLLKHRGVVRGRVELDDLFEPPLSIYDAADKGIKLFGEQGLKDVIAEMNQTIFTTAA